MKDYNKKLHEIEQNKKVLNESEWLEITDYLLDTLEDFLNLSGKLIRGSQVILDHSTQLPKREFQYVMEEPTMFRVTVHGMIYLKTSDNRLYIEAFAVLIKEKKILLTRERDFFLKLNYTKDNDLYSWDSEELDVPDFSDEWSYFEDKLRENVLAKIN